MPINLLGGLSIQPTPPAPKPKSTSLLTGTGGITAAPTPQPNLSTLSVPMGVAAKSPAMNTKPPTTVLPQSQQTGTYHGVAINPGTDAQIASQEAAIDGVHPSVSTQPSNLGTQHPGDPGFVDTASLPKAQSTLGQGQTTTYDAYGNPQVMQNGTGNTNNTQAPSMAQPAQNPATFGGLLGQLANQQNSPYNQMAGAGILGTQGASQSAFGQGTQNSQQIFGQAQTALKQLQNLQNGLATGIGNINQEAIPLQFVQGRDQALQNMYGGQEQALATELQGLGGLYNSSLGQQATGISGLNSSANTALSGQGQAQGALQGAAGLIPDALRYGSNLNPQDQATQLAQAVISGQMTYEQAASSLGYAGGVGTTFLNNAITQAGGNPLQLQAQGSATQSNIQTAGTAGTNIAAQGASQAIQQYNTLNAANSTFENQASQVLSVLSQGGLNGSIPDVNKALNKIGGRFGSTQVQALSSSLTELAAAYTNLLSSNGGTPTSQDEQALATLNPNSSAAQIATSIDQLKKAAAIKLSSQKNLAQGYGNALGGGSTASGQSGSIQVKAADGQSYGFYQDAQGKWHAN